ncbi:MAG: toll/interleukin-1 receptor domain-containing protein [Zoogloeaceae bacterium]|jgi:hypothetical protein|nr:toll/interleukin-1 receptor domain-containing protein [Zoogloeaceae bacterium]
MAEKNATCNVLPCGTEHDSFVFVSYAHEDASTVFPIIERVHAGGYAIWYDKGITISSTWTDEIAIAIRKCKAFLLFVSKNSMESTYVRSEVEFALNQKIRVIPVYLDSMDVLPPGLALGLNATQGVTEIDSPQLIAEQICEALDYNKVRREGDPVALPDAPVKKRPSFLLPGIAALVVLLVALALFLFMPRDVLTLEKTAFAPAEAIHVTLNGVTPEQIEKGALLSVAAADAKPEEYVVQKAVSMEELNALGLHNADGSEKYALRLHAPVPDGKYVLRLHAPDKELTPAALIGEAQFTVTGDSRGAFAIDMEKTSFAPYERIIVRTSGVSQRLIEDGALVGLFGKGESGDWSWRTYERARERDEEKFFDAPREPGEYEIQAHINNQVMDEPTLVASISFQVLPQPEDAASAPPRAPLLTLEKHTFAPIEPLFVDIPWNARDIGKDAIFCIAHADAKPGEYLSYQLLGDGSYSRSGVKLRAPEKHGKYEVRLYRNDRSLTDETLIGVAEFTVAGDSSGAFSVVFEDRKAAYAPNEKIRLKISGVSQRAIEDGALIGIFRKDSKPGEFMLHEPIASRDKTVILDAPSMPGEYEIQAHINPLVLDMPTLVAAFPFTVSAQTERAR